MATGVCTIMSNSYSDTGLLDGEEVFVDSDILERFKKNAIHVECNYENSKRKSE